MTVLRWLWARLQTEPVGAQAVFQAGLALYMAYGLPMTPAQMAAWLTYSQLVIGFLTRSATTPNPTVAAKVKQALETPFPQSQPQEISP